MIMFRFAQVFVLIVQPRGHWNCVAAIWRSAGREDRGDELP